MCYNNCQYFTFNPMKGEGRCTKKASTPCIEEEGICEDCERMQEDCVCQDADWIYEQEKERRLGIK